jgi:hypothetical protein
MGLLKISFVKIVLFKTFIILYIKSLTTGSNEYVEVNYVCKKGIIILSLMA